MEIDPNFAGGGVIAMIAAWFGVRRWNRADKKESAIDEGWTGIVTELRAEISRMKIDIQSLESKVDNCETERSKLEALLRRFGTRKEGGSE